MLNFIIENKSMLNPYLSLIEKEESNLHISLREGILSYLIEKEGQLNKKDSAYFQKYLMEISNNEVVNYDLAKWHVIHDPTTKLFNIPASVNDQLRQYFHGLKENKLDSVIRYSTFASSTIN
ncbi:hypothetical protein LJC37_04565 [Bacteroidales bacterium OttesenSCG-928-E04]|nr:hypothetical protein [Bacteroidales bacterium OttesenSCG-928-E04]